MSIIPSVQWLVFTPPHWLGFAPPLTYAAWLDALPDSLRDGATAQALQDIADLDLSTLADIQPPRGYGRE